MWQATIFNQNTHSLLIFVCFMKTSHKGVRSEEKNCSQTKWGWERPVKHRVQMKCGILALTAMMSAQFLESSQMHGRIKQNPIRHDGQTHPLILNTHTNAQGSIVRSELTEVQLEKSFFKSGSFCLTAWQALLCSRVCSAAFGRSFITFQCASSEGNAEVMTNRFTADRRRS